MAYLPSYSSGPMRNFHHTRDVFMFIMIALIVLDVVRRRDVSALELLLVSPFISKISGLLRNTG